MQVQRNIRDEKATRCYEDTTAIEGNHHEFDTTPILFKGNGKHSENRCPARLT